MIITELLAIVARKGISQIHMIMAGLEDTHFSPAEGGPLFIEFENVGVMFSQVLGREAIAISECRLSEWLAKMNECNEDYQFASMDVFELFCYRCNAFDKPPMVDRVVAYHTPDKAKDGDPFFGLILTLSTGATIGMEASADGGLLYFLDGQASCFEKDCTNVFKLKRKELWKRSAG